MNGPTQEQIDQYQRDGFLVVEQYMGREELERVRERFHACFNHEWPTGLRPDEVNYTPGVTPPDVARQLCNVWNRTRSWPPRRCRSATAAGARSSRRPRDAAAPGQHDLEATGIEGAAGASGRRVRDVHRAAEHDDVLDRARRHARGHGHDRLRARLAPLAAIGARRLSSTRPTTGLGWMRERRPPSAPNSSGCRSRCRPAAARSTTAGRCHGSPPNERPTASAASIISHMVTTETRWHETNRHRDLQPLHAAGRARDGGGVLPDHVARGRLPDALTSTATTPPPGRGAERARRPRSANADANPTSPRASVEAGVEFVYYQFVTLNGRVIGKVVPARHLARNLERGVQFHGSAVADLATSRAGTLIASGGEAEEFVALPDATTFQVLPWDTGFARVYCNLYQRRDRAGRSGRAAADLRAVEPEPRPRRVPRAHRPRAALRHRAGDELARARDRAVVAAQRVARLPLRRARDDAADRRARSSPTRRHSAST